MPVRQIQSNSADLSPFLFLAGDDRGQIRANPHLLRYYTPEHTVIARYFLSRNSANRVSTSFIFSDHLTAKSILPKPSKIETRSPPDHGHHGTHWPTSDFRRSVNIQHQKPTSMPNWSSASLLFNRVTGIGTSSKRLSRILHWLTSTQNIINFTTSLSKWWL